MRSDFIQVIGSLKTMRIALFVEKLKGVSSNHSTKNIASGFKSLLIHA
jgi:hypothetical protein